MNKSKLKDAVGVAEAMLKNIDKNTRLKSVKLLKDAPGRGDQLGLNGKGARLCLGKGKLEAHYRESLYQPSMGYCGVYAVSYYTGVRFDIVFDYIRAYWNKGGTWAGATDNGLVEVSHGFGHFVGAKLVDVGLKAMAVKDLKLRADQWYLVSIRKHVFLMNGDWCVDQEETAAKTQHWCRNKIVKGVYEIVMPEKGGADEAK